MTTIQNLEKQVKQLSAEELREFRAWFFAWDADDWDRQIERDAEAGKLDALAADALAEYKFEALCFKQLLAVLPRPAEVSARAGALQLRDLAR
jgi:hypothetical protein